MTTDLAVVRQLRNTPDLPERDRGAAEAVAAGLRDAKARWRARQADDSLKSTKTVETTCQLHYPGKQTGLLQLA